MGLCLKKELQNTERYKGLTFVVLISPFESGDGSFFLNIVVLYGVFTGEVLIGGYGEV